MKIWQIISFGLDVYRRFGKQKISTSTYHTVAGAFRSGCSKAEWVNLGHLLGIVEPD